MTEDFDTSVEALGTSLTAAVEYADEAYDALPLDHPLEDQVQSAINAFVSAASHLEALLAQVTES